MVWNFLRKNADEKSNGSIETDIVKVRIGLKDLNKVIWQSKLNYSRELANTSLISSQKVALKIIIINQNLSLKTVGESIELKKLRLTTANELAKTFISSEFEIAQAVILEAKKLALLNGETQEDLAAIEAEANLHLIKLNLTAQQQSIIIEQKFNDSLIDIEASDDGKRFVFQDDSGSVNVSGNITTTQTGFFSLLGSLTNRITKLFVQDIDVEKSIKIGFAVQGICNSSIEGTIIYATGTGNKREFQGCHQKNIGVYEWVDLS